MPTNPALAHLLQSIGQEGIPGLMIDHQRGKAVVGHRIGQGDRSVGPLVPHRVVVGPGQEFGLGKLQMAGRRTADLAVNGPDLPEPAGVDRPGLDQVHHVVKRPALAALGSPHQIKHAVELLAREIGPAALDDGLPRDAQFLEVAFAVGLGFESLGDAQLPETINIGDRAIVVPGEPPLQHTDARGLALGEEPADHLAFLVGAEVALNRVS